jgi:hypothetical protein
VATVFLGDVLVPFLEGLFGYYAVLNQNFLYCRHPDFDLTKALAQS